MSAAEQYREAAERELDRAEEVPPPLRDYALLRARVFAELAVSAQLAENHTELPFR